MNINQQKITPPAKRLFDAPVWSLGFRPFYWLGATYGALLVPLWILHLAGAIDVNGPLIGAGWHAHEMVFGFAAAIITGFLFTAVRNWTGKPTPTGWKLAGLAAIWLLARILMFTGPSVLASVVDLAFLPLMAIGIGIPIWQSGNYRNLIIVVLLFVLFLINLNIHAQAWDIIDFGPDTSIIVGLNVFALFITIIAGRVMPMFINNAVPGAGAGRTKFVEIATIAGMALVLIAEIIRASWPSLMEVSLVSNIYAGFLLVLAALQLVRLAGWKPQKTLHNPMLWILPLSYFWLSMSVAFKALSLIWPQIDPIIATHLLAIGAIGGMMLAMMTRSALGHTGYAIKAGPVETACFWLIQVAVIARVASVFVPAGIYMPTLVLTTVAWTSAFGLFSIRYWKILTSQRIGP